ncbi:UNVERIFIED_CONTAM: hypothetical protein RMT77_006332 [Armadillidium vulgare]
MKRGASRDISPSSKRSRSSLGRYDDSSEDEGRRSSRGGSPLGRRYLPPEPLHRLERDEYGRSIQRSLPPPSYKILRVFNLHVKASDEMIRDALYREFKRFGEVSVKVSIDSDDERVAYVYFRNYEEARIAKHSKPRILFYDKPVIVEPLYDSPREYSIPRGRSRSPLDYDRVYRPRTPPVPDIEEHYEPRFDRGRPPLPPHRDYYIEGPPPIRPEDYGYRPHRGRGPHHFGPPHRGGFKPHFGGGRGMIEAKRDKFPNYLHHVAPEDDPLSTRTLFAGNLEINITEEELRRIFGRYGIVDDIDIKRPPPGTGNAYAFVRFQNLDMAHRAKIELSGQYIGKFQCKIGYGKVMPTTRVWVGGLGPWTSLTQLNQEFDRFGAIKKIEYHKGDSCAYILYESLDAAQAAVKEMRGFPLGGPDKKLRTDFAEVTPPPGGPFPGPPGEFREEWGARGYEEYGGEFSGGFMRGRGRGRGWHDRGRGIGHRGVYHNEFQRGEFRDYEAATDNGEKSTEHGESQDGLSSARNLADLTKMTTVAWQGSMILKNSTFATKFHVIEGDPEIAELLQDEKGQPLLKITQRLRLDQPRLDDVSRRINAPSNATILLSLATTTAPPVPEEQGIQSRPLRNLVAYLKQKEAAGVITLNGPMGGVLYAFPPCPFSLDLLQRVAPNLTTETTREDHLVIVIDRGSAA